MEKPTLEQFGLTKEEYHQERPDPNKLIGYWISVFMIVSTGWYWSSWWESESGEVGIYIMLFFFFSTFVLFASGIFWVIAHGMFVYIFVPSAKKAKKYDSAKREYEDWQYRRQAQFWNALSGRQFEIELCNLFIKLGFDASITPGSDDKGVDIWINEPDGRTAVQCKAHKKPVGPAVARELLGAMTHFKAKKAILASLSGWSKGVSDYVEEKPIQLINVDDIVRMQKSIEN
jgi:hypothetical protein